MAHGDVNYQGAGPNLSNLYWGPLLLDAAKATSDGAWVDLQGYANGSIQLRGTFVATVEVHGSNKATKPADADDGEILVTLDTNQRIARLPYPVRWLKCKVSWTSGSVSADGHFVTAGGAS